MKFFNSKKTNAQSAGYENITGQVLKGLALLYLVVAISGCATFKEKFTPKTKANVGIFADTTLSMLSQADLGFARNEAVYVREFFDPADAEEKRLLELNAVVIFQ